MCCISMPLHLYTVMSRIPALIATHANRWFIIGGSEEKIKIKNRFYFKHSIGLKMWINTDLQLYIHVDMPLLFFFFGWNHWVHEGTCCIYTAYMYRYVIFTGTKFWIHWVCNYSRKKLITVTFFYHWYFVFYPFWLKIFSLFVFSLWKVYRNR